MYVPPTKQVPFNKDKILSKDPKKRLAYEKQLTRYLQDAYETLAQAINSIQGGDMNLTDHSVTELNDITSAGSGAIITSDERTLLNSALQTETDPVFIASEAFKFELGDKAKLDNQSGINTGDQDLSGYMPLSTTTITAQQAADIVTNNAKVSDVNHVAELLPNVDNTSDADKPVSTAQQAALDLKANSSQVLTDVPSGAVFTDTLYDDSDVLKDSDTVSPVTVGNKLITQTDVSSLGGGDMLKSVYDTDNNGIVDNAEKVNSHTVDINVPSNAVFTDTTYTVGDGGLTEKNFTSANSLKLAGIATGATANSSDATLKNRANHTGTQLASTISDFDEAVNNNSNVLANSSKISFNSTASAKLDGIETRATADQTATEILTAIKTVDGSGSGLDADLLDGHDSSYFAQAGAGGGIAAVIDDTTPQLGGNLTVGDYDIIGGNGRLRFGPTIPTNDNDILPSTTLMVESQNGSPAILGYSETSYFTSATGNMATMGLSCLVKNNNTSHHNTAYAAYMEARKYGDSGYTQGLEVAIINLDSTIKDVTCDSLPDGSTMGLWISSGRSDLGYTSYDSSVALGITHVAAGFRRGIVITDGSLALVNNNTIAMLIPDNSRISWGNDDTSIVHSSNGYFLLTDNLDVSGEVTMTGFTMTTGHVAGYVLTSDANGIGTWQPASGGGMTYPSSGIAVSTGSGWTTSIANNSDNWNNAYSERLFWDGSASYLNATTGRSSLGLGAAATYPVQTSMSNTSSYLPTSSAVIAYGNANWNSSGGLSAVVDDTAPHLGGNLYCDSHEILMYNNKHLYFRNAANSSWINFYLNSSNDMLMANGAVRFVSIGRASSQSDPIVIRVNGKDDQQITVGAADSAGAGYRVLRVAN